MRIAVIGVGLIGGSIGLAARERAGAEVVGFDPAPGVLEAALEVGALDRAAPDAAAALDGAEAAFVAAPVGALPAAVGAALAAAGEDCVVTDVGSTKRAVVDAVRDERFIGGHPLAGAANAGVRHARAELFDGATWYLTPTASTRGTLYERLHRLLSALGARPAALDAETHDRMLATVSHLPHVLANVLVAQAARALSEEERAAARDRPELPRHHARGRRQHGDLARHLPRQRRRADRRDRRRERAARAGPRDARGRRRRRGRGLERRRARGPPPAARGRPRRRHASPSCASRSRTGRASSPRSRSRSAAAA